MQNSNPYPIFASHLRGNAANKKTKQNGVVVQLVRIPACHAGGRGFESRPFRQLFRGVVQLVEHRSPKPGVGSSSLSAPASYQLSNNKIYTSL